MYVCICLSVRPSAWLVRWLIRVALYRLISSDRSVYIIACSLLIVFCAVKKAGMSRGEYL